MSSRDVPPTSGPLGILTQINYNRNWWDASGGGGGGGGGNVYPINSSIGAAPSLTGASTLSATYTGTGGAGAFTDVITFMSSHTYQMTWVYTTSNVGDFLGSEVVRVGTALAIAGGAYYSPPAALTGANTDDGALLTGRLDFPKAPSNWSTTFGVSFQSPGNPSTITSHFSPGLSGGYRITLTDFGPAN